MRTQSSRIDGLGTTIFARMSALAASTGAVNLGQGFPDTDGPDAVIDAAVAALRGGANQYAPGPGVPDLRLAVAEHQRRWYGLEVDPETEVAVTTGATEAIAAAVLGIVEAGDEVIVLEPYYDSYVAVLQMAGAVRRPVTLRAPDFRLPVDELRAAVTPRTTAILLNTPHNPTGTVLTPDELAAVAQVARDHDLVVISDEVYEHLTFDVTHVPIATLPGMRERTLTISSGGKTFSFTGWKVGWATGPESLVRSLLGAKQFLTFTSGAPLQPAIAAALRLDDDYFASFTDGMRARRDQLCAGLADVGFDVVVPDGTYFATTDIRPLGFEDGLEFCLALPERVGVVAVPHQVFHDPDTPLEDNPGRPLVRWAFCKRPDVIDEAVRRLAAL
ncbi:MULTISPECIES: pyridoxal phosphate-dependent aminotransferase [unclassified Aeromicrobium]|uniref:pyridoxal phosphate-dependent aminotransferase n=1 Tax=unclassified Aeromicrobium TaxID=2633570 RepID=UPI0006FC8129|nr:MULTISPECIES: pyridoxal phosphate-dependent aminotransferase [unclassified Aeromicrobium]KQP29358.1 aminotransferase [Aeromicrobium sp. Leaf272]KQP75643.1 aminotransferase [Aeromicrobium sp. Leaf289]